MKFFLKSILAFALLVLSFSMSVDTMDISSRASVCSSCQLSESPSHNNQSASIGVSSVGFDNYQSLSISDVELGAKPVSETNSSNYRLRRIIEVNDSMRDTIHKFFLLRENSLVLDQSKSYYSDKEPHYSTICSDYYVFALRRILI